MLGRVTCVLRAVVRRTATTWWPFIEGRRGQADRPAWRRPAPPVALLAPRRRLVRRPAGDDAPMGGDATRSVERRRAAVIRPPGLPPLCTMITSTLACHLHTQSLGCLLPPGQMRACGAGRPTIWPIYLFIYFICNVTKFYAKQKFKF